MFDLIAIVFVVFVSLTLVKEYQRARSITPLSLLTVGNVLYSALTPVISHFEPESTVVFDRYVSEAGMLIDETGLIRAILAATLFQLGCLGVALMGADKSNSGCVKVQNSGAAIQAATLVGWFMFLVGVVGVVWLGLKYNGNPWGLYQIAYVERSPLFLENSTQSFLILVGMYGASQLVVAFLMADRLKMAAVILLMIALHGFGIKSKFPVFWVLCVFMIAVINERKNVFKFLLPVGISVMLLLTMSMLRGIENLSELPEHILMNQEEIGSYATRFWENDIPGPASITYYVINDRSVEYTLDPLLEIPKLLIPRPLYDRGAALSDVWAAKMMGINYEPGLGFGWSLLCDGFLAAGWFGVMLIAYCIARLARYISELKTSTRGNLFFFYSMASYTCGPIFLYGIRESAGGLVKALLIMAVLLWLPTLLLLRVKEFSCSPETDRPCKATNDGGGL
jgi:hypothetical protein